MKDEKLKLILWKGLFSFTLLLLMGACTAAEVIDRNITDDQGTVLDDPSDGGDSGTGDTDGEHGGEPSVSLEDLYQLADSQLLCESQNYARKVCKLPKGIKGRIYVASVGTQHSQSDCVAGESFKVRKRSIVVKNGCRATFDLELITNIKGTNSKKSWDVYAPEATGIDGEPAVMTDHPDGIGIDGGAVASYQINHDPVTGESETITFELPENTFEIDLHISRLFKTEGSGERMGYQVLNDDMEVVHEGDSSEMKYKKDSNHRGVIRIRKLGSFLVVFGLEMETPTSSADSSDFLIEKLRTRRLQQ